MGVEAEVIPSQSAAVRTDRSKVDASVAELHEDCDELRFLVQWLAGDGMAARGIEASSHGPASGVVTGLAQGMQQTCEELEHRLARLQQRRGIATDAEWRALTDERDRIAAAVRPLARARGALMTIANWQSPPFGGSRVLPTSTAHPRLAEHYFDYGRDRTFEGERYERLYLDEYYPQHETGAAYAYLAASGMAAFTTVVVHVQGSVPPDSPILVGKSCYHENRDLLTRVFGSRITWIDDESGDELPALMLAMRPGAVFLDSCGNSFDLPCPDVARAMAAVCALGASAPYLVVDATCTPLAPREWLRLTGRQPPGKIFIVESLLKYHQLGLDAVNAGIIVAFGRCRANDELWYLRAHLGTGASDAAAETIPPPNRERLLRRLLRLERNTRLIAGRIDSAVSQGEVTCFERPRCPVLASQKSAHVEELPFRGSIMNIALKPRCRSVEHLRALSDHIIQSANAHDVSIHCGTSFGFSTTRLYLTAATTRFGTPFLRLSPGTECLRDAEAVVAAVLDGCRRFDRTCAR